MTVHGHGQCAACGITVEPCCAGAGNEADALPTVRNEIDAGIFPRLFRQLGGERATVTEASLLHAFVARQGGDLDEARLVVGTALRLGKLQAPEPGLLRLG